MTPERLKEIRDALQEIRDALQDTEEQIPGQQLDPAYFAISELLAYIEELEADRDRLDWLLEPESMARFTRACVRLYPDNGAKPWPEQARAAIDAARAAARQSQQKPEEE